MESANKMNAGSESNCVHEQVAKADCECPIYITYTNVNGHLIPNLTYKSGEQMEQPGKDGFLRRDYLKNHRNSMYQVMLLRDTIGEHSGNGQGSQRTGRSDPETVGRKRSIVG